MAVYKRNYRAYTGPVSDPRWRWLRVTRFGLDELFESRRVTLMLVISLIPMLLAAVFIYVWSSDLARQLLGLGGRKMFDIDSRFFLSFLETQGWLALFVTALLGPAMVSPDLTNGALPLFLSRPITRAEYVGGKVLVLAVILSGMTWVPLLVLFGIRAEVSKEPWLGANLYIAMGMFLGSLLWIAVLSLVSLAVSAWVKWRIVGTGMVVAVMFIPAGFGAVVSEVLRTRWGMLLNFPYMITLIWSSLLRHPFGVSKIPLSAAWLSLVALCGVALLLLNQRVRARQVVRG